jgi:secreted trypsin-like serine protease
MAWMDSRALVRALILAISILAALPATAGARETRIINEDGSAIVPWQAALVPRQGNSVDLQAVFCGGAIRDATHIITAAHCLEGTLPQEIAVVVGQYDRTAVPDTVDPNGDPKPDRQVLAVSAITNHPNYDPPTSNNDLAILTLGSSIQGNSATGSLPVVGSGVSSTGSQAFVSGWGDNDPDPQGASQPDVLLFAIIDVYGDPPGDPACSAYGSDYIPSTMLCAGRDNGDGTFTDACQGDSGGPLARRIGTTSSADFLIGIVSFGNGCALEDFPGVYTDLANADLNARAKDPSPQQRPINQSSPDIIGELVVGQTLTCDPGTWSGNPQFEFIWVRIPFLPNGDLDVNNAEAVWDQQDINLIPEDEGFAFGCQVRARNNGGFDDAFSPAYGPVAAAGGDPIPGPTPGPIDGVDISRPASRVTRRGCVRRTCNLTVLVSDSGGVGGMRMRASVQRLNCPRGRRGRRCRRPRRLRPRQLSQGVFRITARGLKPGRYRFSVVAIDAGGNTQGAPTRVVLKVRRR